MCRVLLGERGVRLAFGAGSAVAPGRMGVAVRVSLHGERESVRVSEDVHRCLPGEVGADARSPVEPAASARGRPRGVSPPVGIGFRTLVELDHRLDGSPPWARAEPSPPLPLPVPVRLNKGAGSRSRKSGAKRRRHHFPHENPRAPCRIESELQPE